MSANTRGLLGLFVGIAVMLFTFLNAILALRTGISVGGVRLSGVWDHPRPPTFTATLVVLAIFSLGNAALATALAARTRKSAKYAEDVRYRKALASGRISGDVSGWPGRIERQLWFNRLIPVLVLVWASMSYGAFVTGPRWPGVLAAAVTVTLAWNAWRDRRRVKAFRKKLATATI